jgi:predicted dehydrogenase
MIENCIIVGLGRIGMGYDLALDPENAVYTHSRAFSKHSAFQLVGAVDPDKLRRELFRRHYCQFAYPDIGSALQAQEVGVVVIATPTLQHNAILKEVLAHSRPKAILCEKPLSFDLLEAREMVEICESAGVKLFVNYMRRTTPGSIEIKTRIDSGKISLPIKGVAWYSKGFLHNGSHLFNLLEFWLGPFVRAKILEAGRLWGNQDPEPDVQVEFAMGKVVFLSAWEESFSHYTIELLSPSGRLHYDQGGESIAWHSTHFDPNIIGYEILQITPEMLISGMSRYQWYVVDQLANALADKSHTLCTGRQALETLESMHKIINQRYL